MVKRGVDINNTNIQKVIPKQVYVCVSRPLRTLVDNYVEITKEWVEVKLRHYVFTTEVRLSPSYANVSVAAVTEDERFLWINYL